VTVAALRRLQDIDSRLADLRSELAAAQALLRADPVLEQRRKDAAAATAARERADAEAASAEADAKGLETRAQNLNRRLYGGSVHNPHELLEMQQELEALRARMSEAEAVAIDRLDAAEDALRAETLAMRQLDEEERRRSAELEPLRKQVGSLRSQLDIADSERQALVATIDPRHVVLYNRVAAKHHPAVVAVNGDACGGCHLPLSIEERRHVRAGAGIVQCSNCDRILAP
jgi:predicted  nucleic acid-binding Zn-ribbon protein